MSRRLLSALHDLQASRSPASLSIPMQVGGARLGGNLRDRDPALVGLALLATWGARREWRCLREVAGG